MIRWLMLMSIVGTAAAATGTSANAGEIAIIPTAFLCFILLFCSAFFSSAETALFGLQPVDLEAMSGPRGHSNSSEFLGWQIKSFVGGI